MVKISAVIITYNEERNIGGCIDSLLPVADEIVVVDSFSKDRTKEICLSKGVRFIEHPFTAHIDQKNFAIAQASYDYILSLDGDEYLSDELLRSVQEVKKTWRYEAYTMNRLNQYGAKWIRHGSWYPDKKIRLWDRRKGVFGGLNPHDHVILQAGTTVQHLRGDLMHLAYQNASQLIVKAQQYSTIFADQKAFRKRVSTFTILYKTLFSFIKSHFLKLGFLDGYEGLVISVSTANGVFYKYSKLLEANRTLKTSLIITTYNRPDALELVLMSILNLTEFPDEVIVADDGSGPETKKIVEEFVFKFKFPLRHCWQEDLGFRLAAIRNKAIAQSTHPYIIMIDGDMVLPKSFVADHKRNAWTGRFIQASRVLLSDSLTKEILQTKAVNLNFFTPGLGNRKNTIYNNMLSRLFSYYNKNIFRVRGANMSFWKDDVIAVNGFNEDFVGWGREDSEFVVRMQNSKIKKFHLKFAGFAYHLYHPENSREMLPQNEKILHDAAANRSTRCDNGLDKYLKSSSLNLLSR
jgi:glycosyltransferase involved in cell wall biosynthesis